MNKGLLIFGAIQGLVFSLGLLSIKSPKSLISNRLFSLLILTVSLFLAISSQIIYYADYPKFFLASYGLIYLYCPLYCLFTESLVDHNFRLQKKHLLYLLPLFCFSLALIRFMVMSQAEFMMTMQSGQYRDLSLSDLVSIFMNIYFVWKSWHIMRKSKDLSTPFAKEWAFSFLSITLFISNLVWLYGLLPDFIPGILRVQFDMVYPVMSFLVFAFGYILIAKAEYFSVQAVAQNARYRNVNLDPETLKTVEQKIVEVIETDKPYKKADFSLTDLSELIGIDKFKLSYTISNTMNTNFTSLTNQYRVEEFIRLVKSNGFANYSTLGIAAEAGFNSKSTFYKAFKEIKGQTPKEFFEQARVA